MKNKKDMKLPDRLQCWGEQIIDETREAFCDGEYIRGTLHAVFAILLVLFVAAFIVILVYGVVVTLTPVVKFLAVPLMLVWVIVYGVSSPKVPEPERLVDPVDEELTRQRAREQYDDLLALVFNAIQGAANITPLMRPNDMLDIQTSSPKGDHFYLERGNVIFQFECDVETAVDKSGEDTIQRELQRYVLKQCSRYPLLISSEAQGRSPVEILDIKNLGGHLLIECCLTTASTIPLIEARRRARAERQQRQQAVMDQDYPE